MNKKISTSERAIDCRRENFKSSSSKIAQKVQNNAQIVISFRKTGNLATQGWWCKESEIEYYLWGI